MKILYDYQIFSWQKFGGISRYFYELMNHSHDLFDYEVSGIFSENDYVKPLNLYKEFPVKFYFKGKQRIIDGINKANSIKKINDGNYDIIHPTYYDPYILKSAKKNPRIIDVHDMIFEKFSHYFKNSKLTITSKKECFDNADVIIANSKKTKEDLLRCYPLVSENKINVIYRGEAFSSIRHKQNTEKQNYVLFTGQRVGYKNFDRFIAAIAPLLLRYDLRLICTGQAFAKHEEDLLKNNGIYDRTICKFVSDNELPDIYANAIVFVFPSLYEGFGFPILEAFAAGCPAILSNASCFPEIAEDAAIYFDPYSVDDMRQTIEKVILDSTLQTTLSKKGFERVKFFSWKKTVTQTYQVYCSVLNTPPPPPITVN